MFESEREGIARPAAKAGRGALIFIFIAVFIDLLGVGILIPIAPFVVRQFNTDALAVAMLSASYSIFQFAATPFLGWLSDRYGRRPILLLSLLGTAIAYFIFGAAGALWLLFLSRIIDGITGGNISIAQAYIADVTPPEDRSKAFGLIGAAFGLGFIIGPALGGLLSNISLSAPAYFAGGLALANLILGYFVLPESLPAERRVREPLTLAKANPLGAISSAFKRSNLSALLLAFFGFNFAFSGLQNNFSLFTLERFGWGPNQNAILFSFVGVVGVMMQAVIVRRLVPRFGDRRLAIFGLSVQVATYVLIALIPQAWMLFPVLGALSVGNGLTTPTLTGMVSGQVSQQEQGSILGVTQSLGALTRVFGPLWAGLVFDTIGPGAPYWTGAIFIATALALVIGSKTALRKPVPAHSAVGVQVAGK
ncbi:MAG: MFS transporter [Anaerolineae bacterium]|nr:MFS transporter [Anaerolineae bacterium]